MPDTFRWYLSWHERHQFERQLVRPRYGHELGPPSIDHVGDVEASQDGYRRGPVIILAVDAKELKILTSPRNVNEDVMIQEWQEKVPAHVHEDFMPDQLVDRWLPATEDVFDPPESWKYRWLWYLTVTDFFQFTQWVKVLKILFCHFKWTEVAELSQNMSAVKNSNW